MAQSTIVLAGAAGDLGARTAKALITRGAAVRALVRHDVSANNRDRLAKMGATIVQADMADAGSVAAACEGAACVLSALNGLRDVIVERQGVLLDGAVRAGVPRFIPSDFSADFTRTRPGDNRNLDLRREFMARAGRVAGEIAAAGGKAVVVLGDLTRDDDVERMADEARRLLGGVDILVNNAGGSGEKQAWEKTPASDWVAYDRNALAAVRITNRLLPGMRAAG